MKEKTTISAINQYKKPREHSRGNFSFKERVEGNSKNQSKENSYGVQLVELLYFVIKRKLFRSNF